MKATKITLIALSIALLTLKCYSLYRIKFDIDKISEELKPVMTIVPLNGKVGFLDKYNSYQSNQVIQHLLAPRTVLYKDFPDTILIKQHADSTQKLPDNYRVLLQYKSGDKLLTIIARAK